MLTDRLPRASRIVSLLDMINFNGPRLIFATSFSTQLAMMLPHFSAVGVGKLVDFLNEIREECVVLELRASVPHIERTLTQIRVGNMNDLGQQTLVANMVQQLFIIMRDELHSHSFFALSPNDLAYFVDSQFEAKVKDSFRDAVFDMEEAGKCYALERSTACVFHLMRVMEYALQTIALLVGITDSRPNWDPVIRKIDAELKKDYKDREFKGSADFLANVSSHLQAIKVAWRNRVMHVEKKHTLEEAREIYNATRALMRYLSENLSQEQAKHAEKI